MMQLGNDLSESERDRLAAIIPYRIVTLSQFSASVRRENLAIYPASSVHGHQPNRTIAIFIVHTTKKIVHEFIVYEKTDNIRFLRKHRNLAIIRA